MNKGIISFLSFVTGAAIGSVIAYKFAQTKYEQIANEEIASVKERFTVPKPTPRKDTTIKSPEAYEHEKLEKKNYDSIIQEGGYRDYTAIKKEKAEKETPKYITVIAPEEYGELYEFDCEELTYYQDGVLADSNDRKIEDVDNLVGIDSLNTFGRYEDDSVFVRNEKKKTDYQILLDPRKYSDVVKNDPHLVGVK